MNHDKANQVEVGEGPKAADAALQRIVRSREAAEAEAPVDIENVRKFLGDLDLGADVGSTEVIDNLGEFDFAGEDVIGEQICAAPADIDKLAETDPKAADAALQRMARAREAREAQALEAETPEAEAPSDIESVEALRGDLDLGADVGSTEAIEHVRELDAVAEAAVEGAIAKAEAYEAQDVLDEAGKAKMKLREQIRAAIVKYSDGVEVAKDDPLANDKKKTANKLKKVGLTLADLPPDFWTLPRLAKTPGERSRQSELFRVYAEAERPHELEKLGRPPNYDLLARDERHRVDAKIRQRKHRDETRTSVSKPPVALLPVADIAPDMLSSTLTTMLRRLDIWARAGRSPRARQWRKRKQQLALIRVAAAYARYFNLHDKPPPRSDLAKILG